MITALTTFPIFAMIATAGIDMDETAVFFPTFASRDAGGEDWRVDVHAWIYEVDFNLNAIRPLVDRVRARMGMDKEDDVGGDRRADHQRFLARLQPFLVDNESFEIMELRIGEKTYEIGPSGNHGDIIQSVTLSNRDVVGLRKAGAIRNGRLRYSAVTEPGDDRRFTGDVYFIEPTGISVISDIDDTIKVTNVLKKKQALRNTFVHPYRGVEGMADVYRKWASHDGVAFHYVSASFWPLYQPLDAMIELEGFPRGSMHLRSFAWGLEHIDEIVSSSGSEHKVQTLRDILDRFPQRTFVLVGDSTQTDPEVYAQIAREHPRQVARIFIRSLGNVSVEEFAEVFRDLPRERWRVFTKPSEIVDAFPGDAAPPAPAIVAGEASD